MARFYCPQWCHAMQGWIDLPSLASTKEREAINASEEFAERNKVQCRVIRKPHGWQPPPIPAQ